MPSLYNNSNKSRPRLCLAPSSSDLQKDIYNYINENPGIRYRKLIRLARTTNGVISYHLGKTREKERLE
jgi:predicted transcriptional regulator